VNELPVFPDLESLSAAVKVCERCDLHVGRTKAVPGEGSVEAEVVFVGEGPGFHEDQQGRPFVGQAGNLLEEMIKAIGMRRSDVFIANLLKCRPPNNRDPEPTEAAACFPYLKQQLALIEPRLVVLLGRYALNAFFPEKKISLARGVSCRLNGRTFLPVYHPAAALRQFRLRHVLAEDFRMIPKLLADASSAQADPPPTPSTRQLSLFP
jgi:uracil-DNA glycosylase family 4